MELFLLAWVIVIGICMYMANNRGRNMFLAFLGGLVFGVLSIIYYAIAGDTVAMRIRKEAYARDMLGLQPELAVSCSR